MDREDRLSCSREEAPTGTEVKQKDIVEENSDEPKTLFQAKSHINNNSETHSLCAFRGWGDSIIYSKQNLNQEQDNNKL